MDVRRGSAFPHWPPPTQRRGGFATRSHARAELNRVLACERTSTTIDDRETVPDYLTTWLATKALTLKPSLTDAAVTKCSTAAGTLCGLILRTELQGRIPRQPASCGYLDTG